jgi:hypothetical protein
VNLPTPEEALAGMARVGSPRVPIGNEAIQSSAAPALQGSLVTRGNTQSADPALVPGLSGGRNAIINENLGAAHAVTVGVPPMTDPAAGATQANGHVVPSAVPRGDSFWDGSAGAVKGY